MEKLKPWQVILFVVAAGSLVFLGYRVLFANRINLTDETLVADVLTGDIYMMDLSGRAAAIYPERHPDTGGFTLLPVEQMDSGEWRVRREALADLSTIELGANPIVNSTTGIVQVDSDKPKGTIKAGQI